MLILLFGGTRKFQRVCTGGLATQMIKKKFLSSFWHRIAYSKRGFISDIQNFLFIPPPRSTFTRTLGKKLEKCENTDVDKNFQRIEAY